MCVFCSWMRPSKRYSGPVAPEAKREVGDGRAGVLAAGVVRLDEVEALAPRAAEQRRAACGASSASRCSSASRYMIQSPVAVSSETLRASANEPFHGKWTTFAPNDSAISTVRSVEPVSTTIISSTTPRSGSRQPGEHLLLVLHDHAEREPKARDGPGLGGDLAPAGAEAAHARSEGALQAARAALADLRLLEIGGRVRQVGIEAEGRLEEIFGRRRLEQLVEEDAGVVQERRLARLGLERLEQGCGGDDEGADPSVRGRGPVGEHGFDDAAAGLVGAVGVVPLGELGERRSPGGRGRRPRLRRRRRPRSAAPGRASRARGWERRWTTGGRTCEAPSAAYSAIRSAALAVGMFVAGPESPTGAATTLPLVSSADLPITRL